MVFFLINWNGNTLKPRRPTNLLQKWKRQKSVVLFVWWRYYDFILIIKSLRTLRSIYVAENLINSSSWWDFIVNASRQFVEWLKNSGGGNRILFVIIFHLCLCKLTHSRVMKTVKLKREGKRRSCTCKSAEVTGCKNSKRIEKKDFNSFDIINYG